MICFFCFSKDINVNVQDGDFTHQINFKAVEDKSKISIDSVYFSTPSDFYNHMNLIKRSGIEDCIFAIDPVSIVNIDGFPKDIGFSNLEEKLEQFKGKKEVKISILNAMSNAFGDHLIGMTAFNYWHDKVCEILKDSKITISFFQLNPNVLSPITKQFADKVDCLYFLPNNLTKLLEQDAYIDLGTLLLKDSFYTENMVDFFFKALSVEPNSVPQECKRIKYSIPEECLQKTSEYLNKIKSSNKIVLFHHESSSALRSINLEKAQSVVIEILEKKSDWIIVSALDLNVKHDRFVNIKQASSSIDEFSSIIALVDGIITVDTCTYHIADSFNVPTVVLFTTIDPDLRIRYYPYVKAIMYEDKDGKIFGKHKSSPEEAECKKELDYLEKLWEKIDVDAIIQKLDSISNHSL